MHKATIKKVYWNEVRDRVERVTPEFAALVDELDPGKNFPLFLATYPYGDVIVDQGLFYVPLEDGTLVPVNDPQVPKDIQENLAYCMPEFPAGVILENSIELLTGRKNILLPWMYYNEGAIFGLWGELPIKPSCHPVKLFTITSGTHSIFMLPNIGDVALHKNLRHKYKLPKLHLPKNLCEHCQTFKELVRSSEANCDWHTTFLFFSNNWLKKIKSTDQKWANLDRYLLRKVVYASDFWRNKLFFDYAFSCAQANRNLRPNPYIGDTAKWIVLLAIGASPAFGVALDNSAAPIDFLQKTYIEDYQLKYYAPTIMQPMNFLPNNTGINAYYSLMYPITLEFSPKSRKLSTALADLIELQHVTRIFVDEILQGKLQLEDTRIGEFLKKVTLDFFHSNMDQHNEVRLSNEMSKEDPNLVKYSQTRCDREFATKSSFVRGCVRISTKEDLVQ
jgi:hypothetical protein